MNIKVRSTYTSRLNHPCIYYYKNSRFATHSLNTIKTFKNIDFTDTCAIIIYYTCTCTVQPLYSSLNTQAIIILTYTCTCMYLQCTCAYHFGVCEFDFSLCVEVFLWLFLHLHYDIAMLDLLPLQWPVRIQLKAINNGTIQLILARLCLVPWTQAYVLYTAMINRDRGWVGSAGISHPWGWFENSTKVLKYVWYPPPPQEAMIYQNFEQENLCRMLDTNILDYM